MAQVIGFIGLGIMGRPMARNLLKAGYPLVVHSRSRGPVDEIARAGAKVGGSPRDVAAQSDLLITMLPNSPDVELVALGRDGIIEGARPGLLFADMSTISPIVSKKVGEALGAKSVKMLHAPVSGGEKGAIDGALSIMVGGDKAVFDAVLPIFQAMGKTITHLGPLGFGGFTKLPNQIIRARHLTPRRGCGGVQKGRKQDHPRRHPDGARRGADARQEGGARPRPDADRAGRRP